MGQAVGGELRDGVNHVGPRIESAKEQAPLQPLAPEGSIPHMSARLKVRRIVSGNDETRFPRRHIGFARTKDDVRRWPEAFRLGIT